MNNVVMSMGKARLCVLFIGGICFNYLQDNIYDDFTV